MSEEHRVSALRAKHSYLDGATSRAYRRPDSLHKQCPPVPPRVSHRVTKQELLKIYEKLDAGRRLAVLDASASDPRYRAGLGGVLKEVVAGCPRHRLIHNRQPENSREESPKFYCRLLAQASQLCMRRMRSPWEITLINKDDIRDMFHLFVTNEAQTFSNHLF